MKALSRRQFAKTVTLASGAAALSLGRSVGANERIRLGFIGLGNRGDQVLDAFLAHPDAEVAAVCDIWKPYVEFAAKKAGGQPKQFSDYRRLLEMKELDAVVIATPDHWHAIQMMEACQAGKDVYVEKPLALSVAEGRRMVQAANRYQRVCQVGIHRRSVPFCREAAELIRSGALGKITVVRAFHIQNEWPQGIGNPPDSEPAPDFNWEAWLGPAPKKAFNKNRTFYRFRWFYDYSGGQLTNFGVHYIDFIHWALGADAPLSVAAMGGKHAVADNREIPDTLEVMWEYPNNVLVTFSQFNASAPPASAQPAEIEFRGTKGVLYLEGNNYQIVPDLITPNEFPARTPLDRRSERQQWRAGQKPMIEPRKGSGSSDTAFHARNFLDCVKSRNRCSCDIETGHRSTSATLIGNIAHKTRLLLDWDREREVFTNHASANQFLSYKYRAPYKLPEV